MHFIFSLKVYLVGRKMSRVPKEPDPCHLTPVFLGRLFLQGPACQGSLRCHLAWKEVLVSGDFCDKGERITFSKKGTQRRVREEPNQETMLRGSGGKSRVDPFLLRGSGSRLLSTAAAARTPERDPAGWSLSLCRQRTKGTDVCILSNDKVRPYHPSTELVQNPKCVDCSLCLGGFLYSPSLPGVLRLPFPGKAT